MGFRPQRATEIVLDFDESDPTVAALHGMTVRCRSMSSAALEEFQSLDGVEQAERFMSDVVIEWDFDGEDGKPLPQTVEALREQEPWVPMTLMRAWYRGLYTPPTPLLNGSKPGV